MELNDFITLTDGHRSRQTKKVKLPQLQEISEVEFKKGSRSLWYKESFDGEATEVDFLRNTFKLDDKPPHYTEHRGISKSKSDGILKLTKSFPSAKKRFWLDLPINDQSKDLVRDFN